MNKISGPKPVFFALPVLLGVAYGLFVGLMIDYGGSRVFMSAMPVAFLFVVPAVMGYITVLFCPGLLPLGVSRGMPDIHGGDGFDALRWRVRVPNERGMDPTNAMTEYAVAVLVVYRNS